MGELWRSCQVMIVPTGSAAAPQAAPKLAGKARKLAARAA